MSQIPNALLSVAVSWLEAALEADLKRVEAVAHDYKRVAFYWEESRNFSQRVAAFYEQAARATTMRY